MHNMFSRAGDCGVNIYYQYTDIIHLNYDDVDKVVKISKEQCGLELVGEDLGNFHVGFPDIEQGCGEVYAIESSCLGNNRYVEYLESRSK